MQQGAPLLTLLLAQSQRHCRDDYVQRDRGPVTTVYAICPASTVKQYAPIDLLSAESRYMITEDFADRFI